MDKRGTNLNGVKDSFEDEPSETVELDGETEEDNETNCLLPPRRGGLSKSLEKVHLKVQWNDSGGNKLAEVLEFLPSDVSDSEDEDSDSCFCAIM